MGIRNWMAACAAAMTCAWAGQAGATIYTFTVTGQVSGESYTIGGRPYGPIDGAGIFGPTGASLAGDDYTAAFTVDSALGISLGYGYPLLVGGDYFGVQSPIISAALTINGQTLTFTPGWADEFYYKDQYSLEDPSYHHFQAIAQIWDQSGEELTAGQMSFNSFSTADGGTAALLSDGHASVSPDIQPAPPVVPEPSTWAMLLLGIGLLGAATRRQNGAPIRLPA